MPTIKTVPCKDSEHTAQTLLMQACLVGWWRCAVAVNGLPALNLMMRWCTPSITATLPTLHTGQHQSGAWHCGFWALPRHCTSWPQFTGTIRMLWRRKIVQVGNDVQQASMERPRRIFHFRLNLDELPTSFQLIFWGTLNKVNESLHLLRSFVYWGRKRGKIMFPHLNS